MEEGARLERNRCIEDWRPNEEGATAKNREELFGKAGKEDAGEARVTEQVRSGPGRDARGPGEPAERHGQGTGRRRAGTGSGLHLGLSVSVAEAAAAAAQRAGVAVAAAAAPRRRAAGDGRGAAPIGPSGRM